MPKPRSSALESSTARRKLAVRKKPYWTRLAPGIALGYRRNEGAGTWSVRSSDGHGAAWVKRIGLADDLEPAAPPTVMTFWEAQKAARSWRASSLMRQKMRAVRSPSARPWTATRMI